MSTLSSGAHATELEEIRKSQFQVMLCRHLSKVSFKLFAAEEPSWEWVFDPVYPLLFDLYHQLRPNVHFYFHPFECGVHSRWFSVDGFDTRRIPTSLSCGVLRHRALLARE